jgi:hypothetical protein
MCLVTFVQCFFQTGESRAERARTAPLTEAHDQDGMPLISVLADPSRAYHRRPK